MLFSCNEKTKNKKIIDNKDSIHSILEKIDLDVTNRNGSSFIIHWNQLLEYDTALFGYFLNYEDNYDEFSNNHWYSKTLNKNNYQVNSVLSGRMVGLYYLNAIYYEDYFFASKRELYYLNKIDSSIIDNEKFYFESNNGLPESNKTDTLEIEDGWKLIKEWIRTNKGLSLEEIRSKKVRPFNSSYLYWYGEQGGVEIE
jgi:hypothetical protein